jgi:ribosomal protein L11 methylase PrmA
MTKVHAEFEGCARVSVTQVAALARKLYAKPGIKYKRTYRPYICPFHLLVDCIPRASVLDVGCGAGLFVLLMARLGRIRSAVGFDADDVAIRAAQNIAAKLLDQTLIRFEKQRVSSM